MFSGEAYDAAKPYVDRVMLEYFYAYTVLKQCLEAAKTVSLFTDEQVADFNGVDKFEYLHTVSDTVTIDDELEKITDQIFDASSEKSVVSHYTAFRYNAQHDRNVFVNKGTESIVIAKKVRQIRPSCRGQYGSGSKLADSLFNAGKNDISSAIAKNALSSSSMKVLYDYYRSRYPGITFIWEALDDKGVTLTEDGLVSFTEAGSYQVRVRSGEYVSDWFWVNADTESEEYATLSLLDEDDSLIENIALHRGEEITPPADPVKDGYTFAGWSQPIPERMPADDIEIYAVWTKNAETLFLPDSKPSGKDSNHNTGAAAGLGAAALAAAAVITVMNRRKSR